MRRDPKKLLYDIQSGIEAIQEFTVGLTIVDYDRSHMLRSACERQFEIIGEAMTRLREAHGDVFDVIR